MNRIISICIILLFSLSSTIDACTSAIVAGSKTANGRPLLWKHRDTGEENNKVERVPAQNGKMEYIAIFNASDKENKEAWMGMNTSGFAIMNTASYNLKNDTISEMDQEGLIMAEALGVCKTVDDFENFLRNHKKPLRVEANFGVIDALGNGAYFETNNWEFTRFNLSDSPNGVLVRTNYSHSGNPKKGYGHVRETNAKNLLEPHVAVGDVTPATFTEKISRTFYNSLLEKSYPESGAQWVIDQDFIPRNSSTATCVIEGVNPGENPLNTVMWIGIGYPPASEIRAAMFGENGLPEELRGTLPNGHSPLCDKAVAIKHKAFPLKKDNGQKYVNIGILYNPTNTGATQILVPKNIKYYSQKGEEIEAIRKKNKK